MTALKITIITPVINAEKYIKHCIENVASQTYANKEHLIVDGISSDNTMDIVKALSRKYPHVRWISEKDTGIYDAMNKGIVASTGDWLFFLGCDDTFHGDNVINDVIANNNMSMLDVIYGNVIFKISRQVYDGKFNYLKLITKNICHQAIFYKKSILVRLGGYDTKYKCVADWVLNMNWFNDKTIFHKYISNIICEYNEDGYSFNNRDLKFENDYQAIIRQYFPQYVVMLERYKHLPIINLLISAYAKYM